MIDLHRGMAARPYAYADIYRAGISGTDETGAASPTIRKNESCCLAQLDGGQWLATWSQGSRENAADEKIVCATSGDFGRTWSAPATTVASTAGFRRAYGCPLVVPGTQRIYLFLHEGRRNGTGIQRSETEQGSGLFGYHYSDNFGQHWSGFHAIPLPDCALTRAPGLIYGHLNHPPTILPGGRVVLPFTRYPRTEAMRRHWQLVCGETALIWCENILQESSPDKLRFSILPNATEGIRALTRYSRNPAVNRLAAAFSGQSSDLVWNAQELTVAPASNGTWIGICRTYLGSPGFTVSGDEGQSWSGIKRLRYRPGGPFIAHPHTMCPLARLPDGRFLLCITNNDGTRRGAEHVWDGGCRTRNPQYILIGREIAGEKRNAGLVFGKPHQLAEADETEPEDGFYVSTCTGIAMPQYFHAAGRHFIQYGLKKESLLIDEIPARLIDSLTPRLP